MFFAETTDDNDADIIATLDKDSVKTSNEAKADHHSPMPGGGMHPAEVRYELKRKYCCADAAFILYKYLFSQFD